MGGVGGCNNVMWSALDDVESWKMLLGWKMLLRCKFRSCIQMGGVGGGVITSCEVRWMMLNPGRCCLVGRCCYVASFVVVYRRGGGVGCNNVMWSALDDVESWKMLLGWKMLLRCKFRCCIQKGGGGGWGGCNNVMWSALDDVESWKMLLGWKMLLRCKFRCCIQKGGWGGWGGV